MRSILLLSLVGLATASAPATYGQTLWTGPTTNYTQTTHSSAGADVLVAGKVSFARNPSQWLFNPAAGDSGPNTASPKDTMWAFGSINNFSNLSYVTFDSLRNGDLAGVILNQPMVVHLTNENIYLSLTFTAWGQHGVGGFAYTRSTPAVAPPTPTVSITNPVSGATFTAPASVTMKATASVSSGAVTNVSFFAGASKLGSVTTSPFNFTTGSLATGSYALTAVATAAGVSATSAVVNITVNPPTPTVTLTNPAAGAVFAAPASLKLGATASVSSGNVTNVAFFAGASLLGSVQASPFNVTGSSLGAGNYSLTAVATAAGVSATSAVVNISVVAPAAVSNSAPTIAGGQFSFSYTGNAGLSYVVESSSNLVNWLPIVTNVASSSSVNFTDTSGLGALRFYEVVRQPNP